MTCICIGFEVTQTTMSTGIEELADSGGGGEGWETGQTYSFSNYCWIRINRASIPMGNKITMFQWTGVG
jgi:hypothetical protein